MDRRPALSEGSQCDPESALRPGGGAVVRNHPAAPGRRAICLAPMSQNAEAAPPARPKRDVEIGIFLVGLVCLMVELLHTRMLAFFLGSISNFLAIPVALFGLALGSLLVHHKRTGDARRLIAILQALVLPVLAAAFVGFFAVANAFFPVIHVSLENPYGDAVSWCLARSDAAGHRPAVQVQSIQGCCVAVGQPRTRASRWSCTISLRISPDCA